MGILKVEVLGLIVPLLKYSSNYSLTSANSTGDILYSLLAGGMESGSKSILYLMALSGAVLGFSNITKFTAYQLLMWGISTSYITNIPIRSVLSPPPNAANTPMVASNEWEYSKLNHAGQSYVTSASTWQGHIGNTIHWQSKYSMLFSTHSQF